MFKDQYDSPQPSSDTTQLYRNLVETETQAAREQHKNNLRMAYNGMLGGAGLFFLGLLWLVVGLAFGRIFLYSFFVIGSGFVGFVSSLGYYYRISD